ncbi:MAG: hypothetical protein AAF492_20335, partial [Verrucomicrobiota bacterium]
MRMIVKYSKRHEDDQARVEALTQKLERLNRDIERMEKAGAADSGQEADDLRKELNGLKEQSAETNRTVESLRADLKEEQTLRQQAEDALAEAVRPPAEEEKPAVDSDDAKEIEDLKSRLARAEEHNTRLKEECAQSEQARDDDAEEKNKLRYELFLEKRKLNDLQALEEEGQELTEEILAVKNALTEKSEELEKTRSRLDELERVADEPPEPSDREAGEELACLKKELEETRRRLEEAEAQPEPE